MNALPHAVFDVSIRPHPCEFTVHGPEVRHAFNTQVQDDEKGGLVLWWLLWDDSGNRELKIAPGCHRIVGEERCLLIDEHPGDCDEEIGFTREELAEGLGLGGGD
jgi:hypothetical protein